MNAAETVSDINGKLQGASKTAKNKVVKKKMNVQRVEK